MISCPIPVSVAPLYLEKRMSEVTLTISRDGLYTYKLLNTKIVVSHRIAINIDCQKDLAKEERRERHNHVMTTVKNSSIT